MCATVYAGSSQRLRTVMELSSQSDTDAIFKKRLQTRQQHFPQKLRNQIMLAAFLCRFKPEAEDNDGARRWRDGSLEEDLPMRTLSEMFNVNYFMVSQTNPHIVPALNLKRRVNRKLGNLLEAEWKHRCAACLKLLPHHTLVVLKVYVH